jgi:glycine/D-amino acid oxidase-like deaminating enzyme
MGGRWLQADVAALSQQSSGWSVATTDGRSLACRNLLIAAGIGTAPILERLGIPTDISPEYGPVLAVRPDTPTHIPSIMLVNTFGFVPQDDGQIWVTGIRAPHVGLDTPRWAIGELVFMVQSLPPAIGPIAGMPHRWVAAGHGGNGMLLAPVTAQIIREYLTAAA